MRPAEQNSFSCLIPRLQRRARRLCRTADEAEDLAQETALRLWQKLGQQDRLEHTIESPDRYAMIMLHNLARERWRGRRPTEELADDMALTLPDAPARIACAELQAAIARLPHDQEVLMGMLLAGESSPQAISQKTGVPLGTVMSRLARARVRLRIEMGLEGDGSIVDLL